MTLDDSSTEIIYAGFISSGTPPSSRPKSAKSSDAHKYSDDTLSYTSTAGATASFNFSGTLLYVFGPVGPAFGTFKIRVDGKDQGTFNSTREHETPSTLLWFGQFTEGEHQVVISNQIDGRTLVLDYFICTTVAGVIGSTSEIGTQWGPGVSGSHGTSRPLDLHSTDMSPFPDLTSEDKGKSAAGAIAGGIIGSLGALVSTGNVANVFWGSPQQLLLFLLWRYRQYRKSGGEGSAFAAFCGSSRKPAPQAAGPGKGDFRLWPMIRSRPKYAT